MELLLQVVDSLIDLYSDEESTYDIPVFRTLSYLPKFSAAVPGVRAAVRLFFFSSDCLLTKFIDEKSRQEEISRVEIESRRGVG